MGAGQGGGQRRGREACGAWAARGPWSWGTLCWERSRVLWGTKCPRGRTGLVRDTQTPSL